MPTQDPFRNNIRGRDIPVLISPLKSCSVFSPLLHLRRENKRAVCGSSATSQGETLTIPFQYNYNTSKQESEGLGCSCSSVQLSVPGLLGKGNSKAAGMSSPGLLPSTSMLLIAPAGDTSLSYMSPFPGHKRCTQAGTNTQAFL